MGYDELVAETLTLTEKEYTMTNEETPAARNTMKVTRKVKIDPDSFQPIIVFTVEANLETKQDADATGTNNGLSELEITVLNGLATLSTTQE